MKASMSERASSQALENVIIDSEPIATTASQHVSHWRRLLKWASDCRKQSSQTLAAEDSRLLPRKYLLRGGSSQSRMKAASKHMRPESYEKQVKLAFVTIGKTISPQLRQNTIAFQSFADKAKRGRAVCSSVCRTNRMHHNKLNI